MAYSWQEETYASGTADISVDIEYLDKSYIYVYLDDVLTTAYSWSSDVLITLDTALTASTVVTLVRRTDKEELYIKFADGAAFIRDNIDTQNTQFLHLAQELVEGRSIEGFYGDLSMNGFRITNLGTPVDDSDAATKSYVDDANEVQDNRLLTLEGLFTTGFTTAAYPYRTVLSAAASSVTPGYTFDKAELYLNGVHQSMGFGFTIADNVITFDETLPAGTEIYAVLGENITPDDGYVSAAQFSNLESRVDTLEDTAVGLGTMSTQDASSVTITGGSVTGITDLAIADGGTGASTASGARTNLGLGSMATQESSAVSITGGSVTGITDLAVADGGTGASSAAGARTNLGAAASGANSDITSLVGLTTPLSVAQGGSGFSAACYAHAQTATAVSLAASTFTMITPTEVVDTLSAYSSGLFTTPSAGYYHIRASARLASPAATTTGSFGLGVAVDSSSISAFPTGQSSRVAQSASQDTIIEVNCILGLNASQVLRVFAYQDHSAALNIVNSSISIIRL